jgi:peptidyl-prolyl cis-trans isomerase D
MPSNPKDKKNALKKVSESVERIERKRKTNPAMYILSVVLLVVIVVTFIGVPVVSKSAGSFGRLVFGRYNGEDIAYLPGSFFARQRETFASQVNVSGEEGDVMQQVYSVWRGAYESTVFHTAALQIAGESGLYVTEDRVDAALTEYPGYLENGRFSEIRYKATPNSEKYIIRKLTRESIVQQQFLEDIILGQKTSDAETKFITSMLGPERKIRFAAYGPEQFPEAQVIAFADANKDLFSRVKLSRILVNSSVSGAREILRQIRDNTAAFEELAKTHSIDIFAEQGGAMGYRYFYELRDELPSDEAAESVMALEAGQTSDVIETSYGWLIFRVDEAKSEFDPAKTEEVAAVRAYMERFERGLIEDYLTARAEELAARAGSAGFQAAAAEDGLEVLTTEYFPINFGRVEFIGSIGLEGEPTPDNPVLNAAASSELFYSTVFGLETGKVSAPIIAGGYVMVAELVDERQAAEEDTSLIDLYLPYFGQQYRQNALYRLIFTSPKFEDNFFEAYYTYVLGE